MNLECLKVVNSRNAEAQDGFVESRPQRHATEPGRMCVTMRDDC